MKLLLRCCWHVFVIVMTQTRLQPGVRLAIMRTGIKYRVMSIRVTAPILISLKFILITILTANQTPCKLCYMGWRKSDDLNTTVSRFLVVAQSIRTVLICFIFYILYSEIQLTQIIVML